MDNEELKETVTSAEQTMPENTETACNCCCETKAEETNCECETAPEKPERRQRPVVEVTQEMLDETKKTLSIMLDYLGLQGTVKAEKRTSKINLLVASDDAGRIIGRKGQSLESLQVLLNRMMQKNNIDYPKIYIDIDGYSSKQPTTADGTPHRGRFDRQERGGFRRDRSPRHEHGEFRRDPEEKEDILRQQALDAAKEVRHWGEPVTLPPMNSHDRRIIHVTLENEEGVSTESIGEGAMKQVVVSPKK